MTTTSDLAPLLKRLKLGAILNTLPERLSLARRQEIDYAAFLQIIITDEVTRRDHQCLEVRLQRAGFEEICRLEDFDWSAAITLDRRLLDAVFSLDSLSRHDHVFRARELGVKIVINTDAHRTQGLDHMQLGVAVARRGWCERGHILNTLPLAELLAALKPRPAPVAR